MSSNKTNKTKINKNNSGWVLCQSKSLPGHFYYYNVLNGEAVWSTNDAELENFKKGNTIHKVTEKSNCYNEPDTPPVVNLEPSTSKVGQNSKQPELIDNTKNLCIQLQLPTFGQTFPKTVANEPCMPNIFWMPIPYPTPIYTAAEVKKPKLDQVTQTSETGELLIQTSGVPLCQRFVNYENPMINFDTKNKILNRNMFSKYATSTPVKRADFKQFQFTDSDIPKPRQIHFQTADGPTSKLFQIKNPNIPKCKHFQNFDIPSHKYLQKPVLAASKQFQIQHPNIATSKQFQIQNNRQFQKPNIPLSKKFPMQNSTNPISKQFQIQNTMIPKSKLFTEPVFQSYSDVEIPNAECQNCTISPCDKVDNSEIVDLLNKSVDFEDLEKNDLRHVLISKRRKTIDADDTDGIIETKKSKINDFDATESVKKKVSFDLSNLHPENSEDIDEYEQFSAIEDIAEDISEVQECDTFVTPTDWCIAVDTDVFLEKYQMLDDFVMSDKNCKVLIPYVVRSEIEAMSVGECRGRQRVIVARHVARRLATPPQHYILEAAHPYVAGNRVKSILNCCLNALSDGYHVVLISEDPQLHMKAKTHNIPCYTSNDIQTPSIATEPELSMELKKIKITIDNNVNALSNMQPCFVGKHEIPVDTYKKQLFTKENHRQTDKNQTEVTLHDRISVYNYEKNEINVKMLNPNTKEPLIQNVTVNNVPNSNNSYPRYIHETIPNLNDDNQFQFQKSIPNTNHTSSTLFKSTLPLSHCNESSMDNTKKIKITVDNIQKSQTTGHKEASYSNFKLPPPPEVKKQSNEFENSNSQPVRKNVDSIETDIDNIINRFYVKNKIIDDKIRRRMDEWICTYIQIMEDGLNDLLQNSGEPALYTLTPPWSIQEAIACVNVLYVDSNITKIIEKLSELLSKYCCNKGKLKTDLETNVFIRILSCGLVLIQQLMKILPNTEYLKDTERSLNYLLETMVHHEELNMELMETPVVCRSEVAAMKDVIRKNYIKDTSYIIEYLKKHYKQWEKYELTIEDKSNLSHTTDLKVVRTLGKNLNMLKIDNNKSISLKTAIDTKDSEINNDLPKNIKVLEKDPQEIPKMHTASHIPAGPTLKKSMPNINFNTEINPKNDQTQLNAEPKMIRPVTHPIQDCNEIELSHGTTHQQSKETAGPKVIRNLKIIEEYEQKLTRTSLDLDMLDYSDISDKSLNIDITNDDSKISCDSNNATDVSFHIIKNIHDKSTNEKDKLLNDTHYKSINDIYNTAVNDTGHNSTNDNNKIKKDKLLNDTRYKSSNDIYNTTVNDTGHNSPNDNNKITETSSYFSTKTDNKSLFLAQNDDDMNNLCNDISNNDTDKYVNDSTICTNDSGFENESIRAHSLVKIFLSELSGSFKIIYEFIVQFVKEVSKDLVDERKRTLHFKASRSLEDVSVIIQELKSIIERESKDDSMLKSLLMNAGVEAAADIRITRYRRVVTKCLEQAQILKNALKIIVAITDNTMDTLSINTESISSSIRYFNIFE